MRSDHPHRQRGQVLPLATLLLLAVAATLFYMFNGGQLVQEKLRLTNTADAVAYSAGVFEARMLNYDAYANRAIIANQIAIGQAVGLASWAKYMGTSAQTIRPYLYLIPGVGAALAQAMDYFESAMDTLTPALAVAVTRHDAAIQALALSQQLMHGPGDAVAAASRLALMQRVARDNDPQVVVDPLPIGDDFIGFTRAYATRDDRRRMGTLVNDRREAFLRSRNWNFGVVLLCHGIELRKRGSTELIDLVDGWKSMDTLSAHHHRVRRWRCRRSERPVGYGSAASEAEHPRQPQRQRRHVGHQHQHREHHVVERPDAAHHVVRAAAALHRREPDHRPVVVDVLAEGHALADTGRAVDQPHI